MKTTFLSTVLFSLLVLISSSLTAQLHSPAGRPDFNYHPGYVILPTGETQYGEVKVIKGKYQKVGQNSGWGCSVAVKARRDGKSKYAAEEILGFVYHQEGLTGDVVYHSLPHPKKNRTVFYELLLDGPIRLYANPKDYPMGEKINPKKLSYYITTSAGETPRLIKKNNYRDLLEELSANSPELSAYIYALPRKRKKFKYITQTLSFYNRHG